MKRPGSIQASLQRTSLLGLCAIFIVFVYATLHESGHALAALAFGAKIQEINVNFLDLSAHADIDGVFTRGQNALIAISGWALPVLVDLLFLGLTRTRRGPALLALRWVGGIGVLGSTLPWVVLPVIYASGGRPSDDVTNFLTYARFPPLWVALFFAILVAGGVWLIVAGRDQWTVLRDWQRQPGLPLSDPETRRVLRDMALVTVGLVAALVVVNSTARPTDVPAGYRLAAEMDLRQAVRSGAVLYAFDKTGNGPLGIYLLARDVRTDYLDVTLRRPDGTTFPILHGEGYSTAEDRSNPTWDSQPAGRYELILTGSPARGTITVYIKP